MQISDPKVENLVAYYIPNGSVSTAERYLATSNNPNDYDLPEDVFAIQFFDRITAEATLPDGTTQTLTGPEFNPTPKFFMRGKLLNREQVEEQYPSAVHAISNMHRHGINKIVKFKGFWFPYVHGSDIFWQKYGPTYNTTTDNAES